MEKLTSSNPRAVYIRLSAQEEAAWKAEDSLPEGTPRYFQELAKKEARDHAKAIAAKRRRSVDVAVIEGPSEEIHRIFFSRPVKPTFRNSNVWYLVSKGHGKPVLSVFGGALLQEAKEKALEIGELHRYAFPSVFRHFGPKPAVGDLLPDNAIKEG